MEITKYAKFIDGSAPVKVIFFFQKFLFLKRGIFTAKKHERIILLLSISEKYQDYCHGILHFWCSSVCFISKVGNHIDGVKG
jgi:hypothetical protein